MLYFYRKQALSSHGIRKTKGCIVSMYMPDSERNPFFKFLPEDHCIPNNKREDKDQNIEKTPKEVSSGGKQVEEIYQMLERAVEQSIDGIAVANMDGIVKFCNKAWAKMHGYQIYEILGKHLSIFHTGEQMERDVIPFNEQVKKTGAHHGEVGHLKKDGSIFLTWMSTTILNDEKGRPAGLVGIARDITERKQAKLSLAASEEKYRKLFEDSIVGIGVLKADSFITANSALLDIFGYESLDEFIRIPLTYHVAMEHRKVFIDKMREWNRGKFLKSPFECKIIRRDGKIREIEVFVTKILIKDEKYLQATLRDITVRKLAVEELQKSREKYRTLTENINVGLYRNTSGAKGRFIEANSSMVKMFGYDSKEEFMSIRVCDLYQCPEDRKKLSKRLSDYGFIKNEELFLRRKDGTAFIGSVSAIAIKDANGRVKYFDGIVEDITESKNAEKALRASEERYRLLIDNNTEPITIYDLEGNILLVNYAGAKNLGGLPENFLKKSLFEFLPEMADDIRNRIQQVIKTGSGCYFEDLVMLPGGEERWFWSNHQPVRDQAGNIFAIQVISRDITERKKAEERQNNTAIGLRKVVEVADELIACPDLDNLFLRAVELSREKLGLERCAIFVEEDGFIQGSYGTDKYGRTTDEHALRFEKNESWAKHLRKLGPDDPKWIKVEESRLEWDGRRSIEIDRGWIVLTPIQSAQRPIGVFVNDAVISKSGIDQIKQDTLAVFCSLLGNIAERKRAEKELVVLNKELFKSNKRFKQLAFRDSHTGLYNHRYLQEAIESEFSRSKRYGFPLSVIMLDLDYFKSINDAYDHQFGDLVLKQFARQIKRMVRRYDAVIRFGGEEFFIVSPGIDRFAALNLAQRILDFVSSSNFGNEKFKVRLKLSVAVVSYPENKVAKGMDLVELADRILNKAKENGGSRVYSSTDIKELIHPVLENDDGGLDVKSLRIKISRLNKRANQSLIESVFAFARTIKLKDQYTGEHVESTVCFATEIANKLGLCKNEIEQVKRAAMLHDLGKIGISEKILLKRSQLTPKEFDHIKKHPQIGADILRPIHSLHGIIPLVLYHHEKWDGSGYPKGLKEDEIPLGARIVAIADVYHALISDRPYRKAFSKEKARVIIREGAGAQFDPEIVDLFLKVIK
ncbi:PAS domain S-box protein [Candidatus Omnitrophota bacterium]